MTDRAPVAKVQHRTVMWVGVTGVAQAWKFALTIAGSVILSRLLAPRDFGLVATIGPIIAFADLLRDLGFTQAVVQRRDITTGEVSALFWLSMALTVLLATILTIFAPTVAYFFKEPRLALLLVVAAWTLVLGGLSVLPTALLNRELRFVGLAVIDCAGSTVGLTLVVGTAWVTHSYWALMLSGIGYAVTAALISQRLSGWLPGRPDFGSGIREMARFGAGVSLANFAVFFGRNADNLLIAKADGPQQLGLYDRAYKLMLMPLSQVTWPLSRVFTPILTRQVEDPAAYSRIYFKAVSYLALAMQPGLLVCIIFSRPFIEIVLGSRWADVAPIFTWLGVAAIQQLASSSFGWLFLSQGRSKDFAISSLVGAAIAVLSFLIGLRDGPVGVAVAYAIGEVVIRGPFSLFLVCRRGPISTLTMVRTLVLPHGAAVLASVIVLHLSIRLGEVVPILALARGLVVSYAAYLAVLSLWPGKRHILSEAISKSHGLVKALAVKAPG